MTELVPAAPAREMQTHVPDDPTGGRLVAWASGLAAAHQIGSALCQTSFAPAAFRNKPEEAAAAIMFGDEVGLTPTQSLRSIYVVSGTPSLYARAMVALVLGAGHEIWTTEDSPTKVTVCGRRRGSNHVETVTWTPDRAQRAGYTSNKKYQSDPQSMLWARAAGDVARRVAPDVLAGVAYTVEEMELSEVETATVSRGAPKAKVSRKAVEAPPAAEPELEPESPPSRGRDGVLRKVKDVDLPEPGPTPQSPPASPPTAPEGRSPEPEPVYPTREQDGGGVTPTGDRPGMITQRQLRMMMALLKQAGLSERDARLDYCQTVIGRQVDSSADLTKAEGQLILDRLVELTRDSDGELPLDGGAE